MRCIPTRNTLPVIPEENPRIISVSLLGEVPKNLDASQRKTRLHPLQKEQEAIILRIESKKSCVSEVNPWYEPIR
jgi:hypothetical protein